MNKFVFTFCNLISSSSLFAEEAVTKQQGNYMQSIIMILLAVVFFYFILWRPEQKRRKAQQKQRDSLKTGDKVTAMGIIGTIDRIEDNTIILKNIDGSKMEILKAAITDVKETDSEKAISSRK